MILVNQLHLDDTAPNTNHFWHFFGKYSLLSSHNCLVGTTAFT